MRRVLVIAASSLALAACSSSDFPKLSMPSFDVPTMSSSPATSSLEFESEPSGAEVRTSTGQTCRTPCALSVAASELSATFSLPGYQPQTVPVRMVASSDGGGIDPMTGQTTAPRMSPNPVYAELTAAAPARRPAPATANPSSTKKKPKAAAKPKPSAAAEPMTAAPASQPSSAWPAPQATPR